eukprot:m.686479 g.686479  ORF g.686479 m.686479 type:complete len:1498 (-) comp58626_c0_seq59:378-4871(-)
MPRMPVSSPPRTTTPIQLHCSGSEGWRRADARRASTMLVGEDSFRRPALTELTSFLGIESDHCQRQLRSGSRILFDFAADAVDELGTSLQLDVSVRSPWAQAVLARASAYQLTAVNDTAPPSAEPTRSSWPSRTVCSCGPGNLPRYPPGPGRPRQQTPGPPSPVGSSHMSTPQQSKMPAGVTLAAARAASDSRPPVTSPLLVGACHHPSAQPTARAPSASPQSPLSPPQPSPNQSSHGPARADTPPRPAAPASSAPSARASPSAPAPARSRTYAAVTVGPTPPQAPPSSSTAVASSPPSRAPAPTTSASNNRLPPTSLVSRSTRQPDTTWAPARRAEHVQTPPPAPPAATRPTREQQQQQSRQTRAQSPRPEPGMRPVQPATRSGPIIRDLQAQQSRQQSRQGGLPAPSAATSQTTWKCIPACGSTFRSDNKLLEHVELVHSRGGLVHLSVAEVTSIGLRSCRRCMFTFLDGTNHPANCLRIDFDVDGPSTTAALTQCLAERSLLQEDFSSIACVQQTSWQQIFNKNLQLFKNFPRAPALVAAFREIFLLVSAQALDTAVSPMKSEGAWKFLFMLPWLLLQRPKQRTQETPKQIIQRRIQKALRADWASLIQEATAIQQQWESTTFSAPRDPVLARLNKVTNLARDGEFSKATQILTSDDKFLDPSEPAVREQVAQLFRAQPYTTTTQAAQGTQQQVPGQLRILPADVKIALANTHRAAAGPSGWSVAATKMLCMDARGRDRLALILSAFINLSCPADLIDCINNGKLTLLSKPNGGVRPIIAREVWLRTLAKCVAAREQHQLAASLAPLQAGVGVHGGTEFVIHSVRQLLAARPDFVVLAVDCHNAYGTISRKAIREGLDQATTNQASPLLQQYFATFVMPPASCALGDSNLAIAEGITQGDPLSPLFFSIGLQNALNQTQQVIDTTNADNAIGFGRVFAYLDDVIIVGTPAQVNVAFTTFKATAINIGLKVNAEKTKLLSLNSEERDILDLTLEHGLKPPVRCMSLLGTPVGCPTLESQLAVESIREQHFKLLAALPSKQVALLLLRSGLSQGCNHLARTMAPASLEAASLLLDQFVLQCLTALLDETPNSLPSYIKTEIRLSLKHGGLGLTSVHEARHRAYFAALGSTISTWGRYLPSDHPLLASWVAALDAALTVQPVQPQQTTSQSTAQQSRHPTMQTWCEHLRECRQLIGGAVSSAQSAQTSSTTTLALPSSGLEMITYNKWPKLQQRLGQLISRNAKRNFVQTHLTLEAERAQFLSKTGPSASAFLVATPSDPGLSLSNDDFQLTIRLWLRVPILSEFGVKEGLVCCCSRVGGFRPARLTELHLVNCQNNGVLRFKHDGIKHTLASMCSAAGLQPIIEPSAGVHDNRRLRFDIAVDRADGWSRDVKLDVSVRSPLAKRVVPLAAKHPQLCSNRLALCILDCRRSLHPFQPESTTCLPSQQHSLHRRLPLTGPNVCQYVWRSTMCLKNRPPPLQHFQRNHFFCFRVESHQS